MNEQCSVYTGARLGFFTRVRSSTVCTGVLHLPATRGFRENLAGAPEECADAGGSGSRRCTRKRTSFMRMYAVLFHSGQRRGCGAPTLNFPPFVTPTSLGSSGCERCPSGVCVARECCTSRCSLFRVLEPFPAFWTPGVPYTARGAPRSVVDQTLPLRIPQYSVKNGWRGGGQGEVYWSTSPVPSRGATEGPRRGHGIFLLESVSPAGQRRAAGGQ